MNQLSFHTEEVNEHSDRLSEKALEALVFELSDYQVNFLETLISKRRNQRGLSENATSNEQPMFDSQTLTVRENEVLVLIASGYTRQNVAGALNISPNTAATHIASIYRKLNVGSIAEATIHAFRQGLIA